MSNDGPNYNDKKVFTNIMQNSGTTDLIIYHYIPNNFKGINIKKTLNMDLKCDQEYTFALTYWDISIVHFLKAAE